IVVLPAAVVAEIIAAASARAGWVVRLVVAALATPVLLYGSSYVTDLTGPESREWSPAKAWLIFSSLAVALFAAWSGLNRLAVRTGERTPLWCLAGAALASGVVIMMSGYATGGQFGVPLAAALGGV